MAKKLGTVTPLQACSGKPIELPPNVFGAICTKCEGTGRLPNTVWENWFKNKMRAECFGEPTDPVPPSVSTTIQCPSCFGVGFEWTQFGNKFLEILENVLVRKYGLLTLVEQSIAKVKQANVAGSTPSTASAGESAHSP